MVTTVTLNPCVDLTVRVPQLRPGALNLAGETRSDIGGKGINVSVVLRALDVPNLATGILGADDAARLQKHLDCHCICGRFVETHGSLRTNIKVMDESSGEMTELNHPGHSVPETVVQRLFQELRRCAEKSSIVVFSGRVPPGVNPAAYRQAMAALKGLPVKIVVDAEGRPLREAMRRRPFLIKPNRQELHSTFGLPAATREDVLAACRKLLGRGVRLVCVSLGAEGALLAGQAGICYAPPLPSPARGLQGAGDSMVAGLCKGLREGVDLATMLRYGVAAASASLLQEGTGLCRRKDFIRLLPQVKIERL